MNPSDESLAKKRFFAIASVRLMGAIFIIAGFILIRGAFELAGQPSDRWMGVAVVLLGESSAPDQLIDERLAEACRAQWSADGEPVTAG